MVYIIQYDLSLLITFIHMDTNSFTNHYYVSYNNIVYVYI